MFGKKNVCFLSHLCSLSSYMQELKDVEFPGDLSIEKETRSQKTLHIIFGTGERILDFYRNRKLTLNEDKTHFKRGQSYFDSM